MICNYQQKNYKKHLSIRQVFFILCCFTLFFLSYNSHADIQLSLQPTPVVVSEPASLTINSTEGRAHIEDLPAIQHLEWEQNKNDYSRQVITINGKRFEKTVYQFTVSKPGIIILPPMEIIAGNNKVFTQEKKIRVVKGLLSDLENQLYIKVVYDINNKENIYTGEEIPLKINLFKADSLSAVPVEYPKIQMNNVVFDDFSKFNRENDRFAPYPYGTPERLQQNGTNYTKTTFFTSFRSLGSGPLSGTVSLLCNIKMPQQNGSRSNRFSSAFDDSFFNNDSFFSGSFFGRGEKNVSKLLLAQMPEINILHLPPSPLGTKYLGLVGNWTIKASLSSDKIKEGEPLTLSLKITGTGSLETLHTPELSIPGFSVYSPEIQKNGHSIPVSGAKNNIEINYVLIPIDSGKTNIDISFATFNPEKGQYKTAVVNKLINVIPDNRSSKSLVYGNTPSSKASISSPESSIGKISNAVLYLKKQPGNDVLIPLWLNHIVLIIVLLLLGPLLWIITELLNSKRKRIAKSLILQRKNGALKRKSKVIKAIRNAPSETLPDIIQNEAVPYINDLKGYPPGTTADELSNKLKEGELAEYLKEANALSYMPSLKGNSSNLKNNLVKALKRLSLFFVVGIVLFIFNEKAVADSSPQTADINQLISEYNNANFSKAEKICEANIHYSTPNPNWIYNLGNCYYQNGNLADALVCYERALRLNPRNSDILENLNLVRRKLFLPEVYQAKNPIAVLRSARDNFRPDEWMVIFAAAWFIIFIALILRRFTAAKIWVTIISIALIIAAFSVIAILSEEAEVYNPKIALVVERNVKIYTLPSSDSSKASFVLTPGDQVNIREKINKWLRIRKGKAEGWVKQDSVARIWPY